MGEGASMGEGPQPSICDPGPNDDACVSCAKENCCDQLEACPLDAACLCLLQCVLMGDTPEVCEMQCGQSPASQAVVDCGDANCPACG